MVLWVAASCGGRERDARRREDGPLPRPSCVVGTLTVRDVAEVARAFSSLAGPALPEGAARADARLWAAALADLPAEAAGALAARGDAFAMIVTGRAGRVAWALPLERGKAVPAFAKGEGRAARRAGRHLVVAPDEATLREIAPWVERTLARQKHEHAVRWVVDGAMAGKAADLVLEGVGALAEELRAEARQMRVQMGRAPEIGEPEAVAGWAEDLGRRAARALGDAFVDATLDLSERSLVVRVVLEARAATPLAEGLAADAPGSLGLLERLPADSVVVAAVRRAPGERREATERTVALLGRLGGARLAPGEAEALGAALRHWDDSTAEEGALALVGSPPTLVIHSLSANPDAAAAAGRAIVERLGQGHLAAVGDRLGLWHGAPPLEVATPEGRVALAVGPGAAAALADAASRSWASRPEVADLLRDREPTLVAAGGVAPTAALELVAPLFGERFAHLATSARAGASSEQLVWSERVEGSRLVVELRIPPPEIRAIAAALQPAPE